MKVALFTLAMGERYYQDYINNFHPSQEYYARKHGYDFYIVTEFIDLICTDCISMQKFLVGRLPWCKNYDLVVYIDADIFIHPEAPPIHEAISDMTKIGIVDEYTQPTFEQRQQIQIKHGWERTPTEYYALAGFHVNTWHMLNGGLFTFSPAFHMDYLEKLYTTYCRQAIKHPRGMHFEMALFGYHLICDENFIILDNRFNMIWWMYKSTGHSISSLLADHPFIHFAGHIDYHLVPELNRLLS